MQNVTGGVLRVLMEFHDQIGFGFLTPNQRKGFRSLVKERLVVTEPDGAPVQGSNRGRSNGGGGYNTENSKKLKKNPAGENPKNHHSPPTLAWFHLHFSFSLFISHPKNKGRKIKKSRGEMRDTHEPTSDNERIEHR
ncbi:hypothetical protein Salat_2434900 [Sesamum alatum]|uniref:Uncharacterized protein n=1 Tax=Sesamum alatum TaxID=300844 RepID=A0AAE1XYC4_9LAMI|nr:hypothetical protein Salat_2434900 [Sesamum alatum]